MHQPVPPAQRQHPSRVRVRPASLLALCLPAEVLTSAFLSSPRSNCPEEVACNPATFHDGGYLGDGSDDLPGGTVDPHLLGSGAKQQPRGSQLGTCGMEGDKCAMPRDCCEAHACVEGDWGTSSDYSCERTGPKPTEAQYVERLRNFYQRHNPRKAHWLAVEEAVRKWAGREERMFHVLRQKYNVGKDEL